MNTKNIGHTQKRWRWLSLFALLLAGLPLPGVLAHGGGELKEGNVPIGRYLVSVWVNPPAVQAGQVIHVTVGIADETSGAPVLDARVDVQIVDEAGDVVATAVATTEQSINRLFYEADLATLPTGTYEMQLIVNGADGAGDVRFALAVVPRQIWPWLVGAVVGLGVIGLVVRGWRQSATKANYRGRTAVPRRRSVD
ncbi:MAG: hypothetical protein KC445_06565 [Anaerolineales bacterium]|nr:hypothetical protein [Anaerolineales bacterium]